MDIKKEAEELRKQILAEFEILDQGGLSILAVAIESYIRMCEAREIVNREGLTYLNRFNEIREHPSLNTERKARAQFLQAIKQLNLDVLPPNHRIGRPGGR